MGPEKLKRKKDDGNGTNSELADTQNSLRQMPVLQRPSDWSRWKRDEDIALPGTTSIVSTEQ